jgi:hypothetical protein
MNEWSLAYQFHAFLVAAPGEVNWSVSKVAEFERTDSNWKVISQIFYYAIQN